jgi:hypothetical protein
MLTLCGCPQDTPPAPRSAPLSQTDQINTLAADVVRQLSESPRIQGQLRVGVAPFTDETGQAENFTETLRERIQGELARQYGKFEVIAISNMDKVLEELKRQDASAGAMDPATISKLGHLVGAQALVMGKMTDAGTSFDLECVLNDVQTDVVRASASGDLGKYGIQPPASPSSPSDASLQPLVAPIALYPDPILADILPASTYPDQVQQAGQFVQSYPNATDDQITAQNWDPSVQALAHYPALTVYMAGDPQWTASLGSAFASNQVGVMAAIQDLRGQAVVVGNLQSTPDVAVVHEGSLIYIRPAEEIVVLPRYDPIVVYHEHYTIEYEGHFMTGAWLVHGIDWSRRVVYRGDWHGGYVRGASGWQRDRYWAPPPGTRWAHDSRWGPVKYVPPARFGRRTEMANRPFETVHPKYLTTNGDGRKSNSVGHNGIGVNTRTAPPNTGKGGDRQHHDNKTPSQGTNVIFRTDQMHRSSQSGQQQQSQQQNNKKDPKQQQYKEQKDDKDKDKDKKK